MPYIGKQPANVPVTADDIPANSIDASKIIDGAITIADIADDAVTADKLANSINSAIAANTAKVTNSTSASDLSSGTLPMARLSGTLPALNGSALTSVRDTTGGRKNLIINGGFDVWQRGTSATKSGNGYGGYLAADRWAVYYNGNTISRQTGTFNGSTKYVGRVAGLVNTTNYIFQKIESASSFVSGKTVTQSYWARANINTTLSSSYRFYDSGSENNNVQTVLSDVSLTTSWQKFTDTRVLTDSSTDLTRDLFVLFYAPCDNAGDYIEIADVQVEIGSVATDFEHRSYGEELALCQRYYQKSYGEGYYPGDIVSGVSFRTVATSSPYVYMPLASEMRGIPSITIYNGVTGATGTWRKSGSAEIAVSTYNVTTKSFVALANANATFIQAGHYTAESEL